MSSDIEDLIAHAKSVTAYIEAATAHTATGAIKTPFEPTATAPEKMAKPFSPRSIPGANWSGPCKIIEPATHFIAIKYGDNLSVVKHDVKRSINNNLKLEMLLHSVMLS